eukprot:8644281-Pyramimonas_sp.AAC.1
MRTLRTHGSSTCPPGSRAFPGRQFSARAGRVGPAFQRPSRVEKLPAALFELIAFWHSISVRSGQREV